jgi:hypothetical protein
MFFAYLKSSAVFVMLPFPELCTAILSTPHKNLAIFQYYEKIRGEQNY